MLSRDAPSLVSDVIKHEGLECCTDLLCCLEVIEACWLFDVPASEIEVVVHPQSIVHSMVEYSIIESLLFLLNLPLNEPSPSRLRALKNKGCNWLVGNFARPQSPDVKVRLSLIFERGTKKGRPATWWRGIRTRR